MLAEIQLKKYYISDMDFKYTPHSESEIEKNVSFKHQVAYPSDNTVEVSIYCKVSDESGLEIKVTMKGIFAITSNNADLDDVRVLCERNTLAILFPYLRSAISDISLKANVEPIILPTVNIVALIDQVNEGE